MFSSMRLDQQEFHLLIQNWQKPKFCQVNKDFNAEEQDIEVLTSEPANPTTQSPNTGEAPPLAMSHAQIALNRTFSL